MKKILYCSFLYLFLFINYSCSNKKISSSSKQFEVSNATITPWSGGTPDAGRGMDYHIFLTMKTKEAIKFDSLWADSYPLAVDAKMKTATLMEIYAGYTEGQATKTQNPLKIQAQGVLKYTYKGKTKYLKIKQFNKQKAISFQ